MNKLTMYGTDYELHLFDGQYVGGITPLVVIKETAYYGVAIPNTPKEKPPIGLKPFRFHVECRLNNIYEAIKRYQEVNKDIPKEWVAEMQTLEATLKSYEKEKPKSYEILERYDYCEVPCDGYISPIKSVKRISDSEIFSIGDKVERMDDNDTIDAFILNYKGNDMWVSTDVKNGYGSSLECAKKAIQPILTTADGKDVYEGDRVWFVTPVNDYKIEQYDFIKSHPEEEIEVFHDIHKYFSTREAADNWVKSNKIQFSYREVAEIYFKSRSGDDKYTENGKFVRELSNLARSKDVK